LGRSSRQPGALSGSWARYLQDTFHYNWPIALSEARDEFYLCDLDGSLSVFSTTAERTNRHKLSEIVGRKCQPVALETSGDGASLFCADTEGYLFLLDLGKLQRAKGGPAPKEALIASAKLAVDHQFVRIRTCRDASVIVVLDDFGKGYLILRDENRFRVMRTFQGNSKENLIGIDVSTDGRYAAFGKSVLAVDRMTPGVTVIAENAIGGTACRFRPDGTALCSVGDDGLKMFRLQVDWGPARLVEQVDWPLRGSPAVDCAFLGGDRIAVLLPDSRISLFCPADGRKDCDLSGFARDTWAVVAPDGRFDAGDLDGFLGFHWVFSNEPLRALPPEIYMRDYFEPRLLSRLLDPTEAARLAPIRPLGELNRVQPTVHLAASRGYRCRHSSRDSAGRRHSRSGQPANRRSRDWGIRRPLVSGRTVDRALARTVRERGRAARSEFQSAIRRLAKGQRGETNG
jgi:hypothetical protein